MLAGQPALDPEQPLDSEGRVRIRKEQGFLRRYLFGDHPTGTCGICGVVLPKDLLVAAHIKRRSECTATERCDYRNIVMPMCKLGCDDLFERGYIAVADGHIVALSRPHVTEDAAVLISRLAGRTCSYFTPASALYFQWHYASAASDPAPGHPEPATATSR